MSDHNHNQEHDHEHGQHRDHDHDHDHDHDDDQTPAHQTHLYSQIAFDQIQTLNETTPGSGTAIVHKTWSERLSQLPELTSDADEQLLMTIPFTGQVRLHTLLVRSSDQPSAPRTVRLFLNRDDLDFSIASSLEPTQTIELPRTDQLQEHSLKRVLWNATRSITIFVEDNHGSGEVEETTCSYIGFRGEWMRLSREPVSVLYEAAARPADHKLLQGTKSGVGSHIL
ncbi:MAG: hypothetical protein M1825_005438 [Sarcosagium campestre]|nr:MAG: hypothetical protein M1825_005438 [Sarcosagium campestre]